MSLYEKVDDLENIVDTLGSLIRELNKESDFIDILSDIKIEAFGQLEEAQEELAKKERAEQKELEIEFDRERI